MHIHNPVIHMYTKFDIDISVLYSVITENINFSFVKEYRSRATLGSPCDVIDDIITIKSTLSCMILDNLFISDVKLKLCLVF